jgi:hypothetical protein
MLPAFQPAPERSSVRVRRPIVVAAAFVLFSLVSPGPGSRANAQPDLDQLLKLPESMQYSSEKKGGATRAEWRSRFAEARTSVTEGEKALEQAQAELATVVGSKSEWQFTPPGLPAQTDEDSTTSFQLRQDVKRKRGEVERARVRLRELEVEANLAGIPADWRGESTAPDSSVPSGDGLETGAAVSR